MYEKLDSDCKHRVTLRIGDGCWTRFLATLYSSSLCSSAGAMAPILTKYSSVLALPSKLYCPLDVFPCCCVFSAVRVCCFFWALPFDSLSFSWLFDACWLVCLQVFSFFRGFLRLSFAGVSTLCGGYGA